MFSTRILTFRNFEKRLLLFFGGDFILAGLSCLSQSLTVLQFQLGEITY